MHEQPKKHKTPPSTPPRPLVVLSGFLVLFAAIFLVSVLALHTVGNHHQARVAIVRITKNGFIPATLSVSKGTKVVWTNSDTNLHQVASNPYPKDNILPSLKSEILNNAQTYEYTANTPGTFGYHDQLTPTTNGTLVVQKK
jgi:plastocyanin